MKVVLDANILISGYLTAGLCRRLIAEVMTETDLFLSQYILQETAGKMRDKFKVPESAIKLALAGYSDGKVITLVIPAEVPADACADPKDLPVLGTAVAAAADYLITGDRHLLELKKYRGSKIVSPRDFLKVTSSNGKRRAIQ